ncbi:tRNA(Ile)-lysidine synthase [Austwickia chelonae]|uniref:tRNA(Ile)-lysidine synthase n=1 Tax=Austwickia chelonae NBRC 105200 TaxID=1184607 RepID=K6V486_9MICO|nr:tRNA lysidine(34) synthetase TilS [Austwickia chelonae]GAB76958.1 tRNA(Ile)-lysidine synthase [Austwickia chelonae NBRC 105200]SEW32732.1 tRNA(Ile)-lysidine synthase [Austwickia chelonae]
MTGPHPAVAATRHAVRSHLADCAPGALVLVACSGGADSLALAAAAAFESRKFPVWIGAVIVDHGLQEGSDLVCREAAEQCRRLGLDPVVTRRVRVSASGGGGPEARARESRYEVFEEVMAECGASSTWLGHTRDDQAEQVLLGLVRGSGTRTLSGIPRRRPPYERPLLDLPRRDTVEACRAQGLTPWADPSNEDQTFLRNRVRRLLRSATEELGPGLPAALARTAALAREDADALDLFTAQARRAMGPWPWPVSAVAGHPTAVRGRLWRSLAAEEGCPEVGSRHVLAVDALVVGWRGQGPVALPGGRWFGRRDGLVGFTDRSGREWAVGGDREGSPDDGPVSSASAAPAEGLDGPATEEK